MEDATQRVTMLAAPVVERHGLELLAVEVKAGRGRGLVRLTVDQKGGVGLEMCRDISREVSRLLDEDDPVAGRYALEVTSPGLDWPLRGQRDFDRVEGRTVDVCYRPDDDRVTQVTGQVTAAGQAGVELDIDGQRTRIDYAAIVWAKQALPW